MQLACWHPFLYCRCLFKCWISLVSWTYSNITEIMHVDIFYYIHFTTYLNINKQLFIFWNVHLEVWQCHCCPTDGTLAWKPCYFSVWVLFLAFWIYFVETFLFTWTKKHLVKQHTAISHTNNKPNKYPAGQGRSPTLPESGVQSHSRGMLALWKVTGWSTCSIRVLFRLGGLKGRDDETIFYHHMSCSGMCGACPSSHWTVKIFVSSSLCSQTTTLILYLFSILNMFLSWATWLYFEVEFCFSQFSMFTPWVSQLGSTKDLFSLFSTLF